MVEDNPGDVLLAQEALEEGGISCLLAVLNNGSVALDYLRECVKEGGSLPDLVILDLDLPGKDGRAIMSEIQADQDLKQLPVAILTTSHSDRDISREFPQLRSTFAAKTADFQELVAIMCRFNHFAASSGSVSCSSYAHSGDQLRRA